MNGIWTAYDDRVETTVKTQENDINTKCLVNKAKVQCKLTTSHDLNMSDN
jgi:hypothetical protein